MLDESNISIIINLVLQIYPSGKITGIKKAEGPWCNLTSSDNVNLLYTKNKCLTKKYKVLKIDKT